MSLLLLILGSDNVFIFLGTMIARAYGPNVMLQLPVKRLLKYASVNQVIECCQSENITCSVLAFLPNCEKTNKPDKNKGKTLS